MLLTSTSDSVFVRKKKPKFLQLFGYVFDKDGLIKDDKRKTLNIERKTKTSIFLWLSHCEYVVEPAHPLIPDASEGFTDPLEDSHVCAQ